MGAVFFFFFARGDLTFFLALSFEDWFFLPANVGVLAPVLGFDGVEDLGSFLTAAEGFFNMMSSSSSMSSSELLLSLFTLTLGVFWGFTVGLLTGLTGGFFVDFCPLLLAFAILVPEPRIDLEDSSGSSFFGSTLDTFAFVGVVVKDASAADWARAAARAADPAAAASVSYIQWTMAAALSEAALLGGALQKPRLFICLARFLSALARFLARVLVLLAATAFRLAFVSSSSLLLSEPSRSDSDSEEEGSSFFLALAPRLPATFFLVASVVERLEVRLSSSSSSESSSSSSSDDEESFSSSEVDDAVGLLLFPFLTELPPPPPRRCLLTTGVFFLPLPVALLAPRRPTTRAFVSTSLSSSSSSFLFLLDEVDTFLAAFVPPLTGVTLAFPIAFTTGAGFLLAFFILISTSSSLDSDSSSCLTSTAAFKPFFLAAIGFFAAALDFLAGADDLSELANDLFLPPAEEDEEKEACFSCCWTFFPRPPWLWPPPPPKAVDCFLPLGFAAALFEDVFLILDAVTVAALALLLTLFELLVVAAFDCPFVDGSFFLAGALTGFVLLTGKFVFFPVWFFIAAVLATGFFLAATMVQAQ